MIFKNARLILSDRIEAGAHLRVADGKITDLGTEPFAVEADEEVIDVSGNYLAPGFIDLHIHGALRRDAMEATPEAFETICKFHAGGGTTSLALTTITAPLDDILRVLEAVKSFQKPSHHGASVLGVHLEGPYFSAEKPGAHRADLIRNPERHEYEKLLEHSEVITQMTLAPELPGALPLIESLCAHGIRASGGHSNAWDEDACAGFVHGMRQVTHTFNCMSSARRRGAYRVAGVLEFAMSEPEILCELIADGRHVSPTLMRMLYHAKGEDGIALVTDATAGAGLAEGEHFLLGELDCVVRDEVGLTSDGSTLAGSTSTMIRLVRNMVELAGVPLVAAVRMATLNPATALGIHERKGRLRLGTDADLVVLSADLDVLLTLVGGRMIYSSDAV
ncbi:MAG: N-acetylglucosamine-6-phosphate deacetylase [Chthoniobacter sp.]|nr:N-acetylglucosamine-6-phosphate deacetylase [Chthoniobacter sp.]